MDSSYFTNSVRSKIDALKKDVKGCEFSDIIEANPTVDEFPHQYVDLVMEGGGMLGIALVGYTYALEEVGIRFLRVGGTSAGAINALLMSAMDIPANPKSLRVINELANKDFYDFVDGDEDSRKFIRSYLADKSKSWLSQFIYWAKVTGHGLQVIDNLTRDLGLNPGKNFLDWLKGVLWRAEVEYDQLGGEYAGSPVLAKIKARPRKYKGVKEKRDLDMRMQLLPPLVYRDDPQSKRLTLKEADPKLVLITADLSTETKVDLPRMAELYWNNPEAMSPAVFVRCSMSIPGFFHPYRVAIPTTSGYTKRWEKLAGYGDGKDEQLIPTEAVFVDGGIMSNFPIDMFHDPTNEPKAPTFGVKLGNDERKHVNIKEVGDLGGAIFNSARHTLDYDFIFKNPEYKMLVAYIPAEGYGWLDFDMKDEQKLGLFHEGVDAAGKFLRGFNWAAYKNMRRSQPAPEL